MSFESEPLFAEPQRVHKAYEGVSVHELAAYRSAEMAQTMGGLALLIEQADGNFEIAEDML